jgi:hypothetical protein
VGLRGGCGVGFGGFRGGGGVAGWVWGGFRGGVGLGWVSGWVWGCGVGFGVGVGWVSVGLGGLRAVGVIFGGFRWFWVWVFSVDLFYVAPNIQRRIFSGAFSLSANKHRKNKHFPVNHLHLQTIYGGECFTSKQTEPKCRPRHTSWSSPNQKLKLLGGEAQLVYKISRSTNWHKSVKQRLTTL